MRGIYTVEVGVALSRPPKTDEYRLIVVVADSWIEAETIACQIAACHCVMPTESVVIDGPMGG